MSKADRFKAMVKPAESINNQTSEQKVAIIGALELKPEGETGKETLNTNNEHKETIQTPLAREPRTSAEPTRRQIVENLQEKALARRTKQQTHRRQTYEIRLGLIERFDKISLDQHRGFKGELINALLEDFLDGVGG